MPEKPHAEMIFLFLTTSYWKSGRIRIQKLWDQRNLRIYNTLGFGSGTVENMEQGYPNPGNYMAISKKKTPTNTDPGGGITISIMLHRSLAVKKMQRFPLTQHLQSQNRCFSSMLIAKSDITWSKTTFPFPESNNTKHLYTFVVFCCHWPWHGTHHVQQSLSSSKSSLKNMLFVLLEGSSQLLSCYWPWLVLRPLRLGLHVPLPNWLFFFPWLVLKSAGWSPSKQIQFPYLRLTSGTRQQIMTFGFQSLGELLSIGWYKVVGPPTMVL